MGCQVCSSDRLACNFTPTTYVSSLPGGEDRLLHPWGGGCPQGVHPDQPSRRSEQDGTWKDAVASRGEQETRSWTLPRPQLSLCEEEQASAEPAHPPGLHLPKVSDRRASNVCKRF